MTAYLIRSAAVGSTVYYSLTSPDVAELLVVARKILTEVLSGQVELLADLRGPTALGVGANARSPRPGVAGQ